MATCEENRTSKKNLQVLLIFLLGVFLETGSHVLRTKAERLFLYDLGGMVVTMTVGLVGGVSVGVASLLLLLPCSMGSPYFLLPSLVVVLVVYFSEERGLSSSWWRRVLLVLGMGLFEGFFDYLVSLAFYGSFSLGLWFFPVAMHSLAGSLLFHTLDLGLSVLVAAILECHQPESVRLRWPFQHQEPYHPSGKDSGHRSVQFTIGSACIASTVIGAVVLLGVTCHIYLVRSISNQRTIARHYTFAAASLVHSDDIDTIVAPDGDKSAAYQAMADRFETYLAFSGGYISSLSLYQVLPGSEGPVIRTIYHSGPAADSYGFLVLDSNQNGAAQDGPVIGPAIGRDKRGWMMRACKPVSNDKGDVVAYLGLAINMDEVVRNVAELLLKVLTITASVCILILSVIYSSIKYLVLQPVDRLIRMTRDFRASRQSQVDESDPVRSGNEFETLYVSIREMEETVVSDNRRMQSYMGTIQKLAYQDELTGASNLTAYDREVERLNEEIRKGSASFSVVMFDINQLKLINDTCGHAKGDAAIKATFRAAREIFPNSLIFRIGGDEFVVLVSGDEQEQLAWKLKLLDRYHACRDEDSPEPWNQVSLSYGVATWRKGQDYSYTEVFERADRAMYQHKASLGCRG